MKRVSFFLCLSLLAFGCAGDGSSDYFGEAADETGLLSPTEPLPLAGNGKFDIDERGPRVRSGVSTEVWAAERAWNETDSAAGIAWGADSGLDWEEKFDAWNASFEQTPSMTNSGSTFKIVTPYGDRELDAPTLECAEVAIFLRAAFAAWYKLPFYLQGWDSDGRQTLYAGHFGFINRNGERVGRFPTFRSSYRDYRGEWSPGQPWPTDSRLRGYRLADDDENPWLSEQDGQTRGAGAYFDEFFLNKRAGYFTRLLLLYFGTINLADPANMFHIKPESTEGGDVLLKRWQRRGIGHTIPVLNVNRVTPERLEITVASGSIPRRQPVWEDPARARFSFTAATTGGVGETSDGDAYAAIGGGIHRWRTAVLRSGRWYNVVLEQDQDDYIDANDHDVIAQRPARFEEILADVSPEEQLEVAVDQVNAAREHLRNYPASCSARTRREDAFERLYDLTADLQGLTRAETDGRYRILEDYVLAELEYMQSKTCCWNRSTSAMHAIIMDYAEQEQAAATASGMCMAPSVFKSEGGSSAGYGRWANHAVDTGRGDEWVSWSADETCPWQAVASDSLNFDRTGPDFCSVGATEPPPPMPTDLCFNSDECDAGQICANTGTRNECIEDTTPPPTPGMCDPAGANNDQDSASGLAGALETEICAADEDWYRIASGGTVVIRFTHDDGDLDMEGYDAAGTEFASSASVSDEERITGEGEFWVRVYGYSGATNSYTISLE